MTLRTRRREARVWHRSRGIVEIVLVTRNAAGVGDVVVVVDVAVRALPRRHGMRSGQGERRLRVVERCRLPGGRGVALLASRGETARYVIRIRGSLKILLVARNASRARQVEVVVRMTVRAGPRRNRMSARQRESHRIVIKFRIEPVVRGVALVAGSRVSEGDVARRRRFLEIRLMARVAHRGHDLELAVGRVLVAGIAIHRCVRAGQREAVVVLLNFLDRHSPSAHAVTLLAIRAQLMLVDVGVAVLAACPHVAEHGFHVALRTSHIPVHTAQRIAGLVVIEFRNRADRLPTLRCMTVLTGDVQIAVRTVGSGLVRSARKRRQKKEQRYCQARELSRSLHCVPVTNL